MADPESASGLDEFGYVPGGLLHEAQALGDTQRVLPMLVESVVQADLTDHGKVEVAPKFHRPFVHALQIFRLGPAAGLAARGNPLSLVDQPEVVVQA